MLINTDALVLDIPYYFPLRNDHTYRVFGTKIGEICSFCLSFILVILYENPQGLQQRFCQC